MENTSINSKTKDLKYYVNTCIVLLLPLIFQFLSPIEPLTDVGIKVVGVFLGLLYGWITIGLIWPSIYGLLMMTFTY